MQSMQRTLKTVVLASAALVTATAVAEAQSRDDDSRSTCRVVYDNLPANRQPAPTDCDSARRIAETTGGRLVYIQRGRVDDRWDDRRRRDRDDDRWDRDRWDDRRDRDSFRRRYPNQLPRMRWAVSFQRNENVGNVRRWLGTNDVRPRFSGTSRNGAPRRVLWYDYRGRIVQEWNDHDRDGRADRVAFYRNGRVYRVIED